MKKVLLLTMLLVCGCGKKLECTYENKTSNSVEKHNIVITFDEDIPTKMSTILTFESDDEEILKSFKENIKTAKENLDEGMTSKITNKDNSVSLTFSKELEKDEKVINGINDYENIKSYFEENGYSCK